MKAVLVLVDVQRDYLASPGLAPAAGALCASVARLLAGCRRLGVPAVHVRTTVDRARDDRMPHWRREGRWACVAGTAGHAAPPGLEPLGGEAVVDKRFFSGFGDGRLDVVLRGLGAELVVLAGLHLHACVRATALDAYAAGFRVGIADDAVGTDDPVHGAITRRYLSARCAEFRPVDAWLALLGGDAVPSPGSPAALVAAAREATAAAREAAPAWAATTTAGRAALLVRWADAIGSDDGLADAIVRETGKPVRFARDEVAATARQLRAIASRVAGLPAPAGARVRRMPLGVVGAITPWNNPAYIPCGKLGAALAHGNAAVWKPSPAAAGIASRLLGHLVAAGMPAGLVRLVGGGNDAALAVAAEPGVDAVTLTGSEAAGHAVHELCARRHVPFQGELGGNNAAVVWDDADPADAAARIAEGAFELAGQRCTANRRAIVGPGRADAFARRVADAAAALGGDDPLDPATRVGPMISPAAAARVADCVARASSRGLRCIAAGPPAAGAWHPPTVVLAVDPADEIVQEETFGPVLVVQEARGWDDAMALCNGVRQGLAAALFSPSAELQERFLAGARAGILKLNRSTAGADVDVPFGGWKASGSGPAEHGECDAEFFSRVQAVYR